jgi:phage tail P2-like protein
MLRLKDASLLDFCNPAIKNDKAFSALCKSLDPILQQIVSSYQNAKIFSNLNNQSEEVLDYVALYHFNVDYYDPSLPKQKKLRLIKNVILDKQSKGTPSRIIAILTQIFGYAELVEWWQPEGIALGMAPNTFGVNMAGVHFTPNNLQNATRAVLAGKNVRSYFTGFSTLESLSGNNYTGAMLGEYDYQVITNAKYVVSG